MECAVGDMYACAAWEQQGLGNTAGLFLALRSTANVQQLAQAHAARLSRADRFNVERSVALAGTAAC
jgi:hypothetical protein